VVGSLGSSTTVAELGGLLQLDPAMVADIVAYLVASGMVLTGEAGAPPRFAEDHDPDLIPWSPQDMAFHAYSRMGRHGQSGAVFPYLDQLPAAPVTKPVPAGPRFRLHQPAAAAPTGPGTSGISGGPGGGLVDPFGSSGASGAAGPALTEVIEASHSFQDFSGRPVTAEQLGELLYRVARIRRITLTTAAGGATYATSNRPYPSTADLYELELYVTLHNCAGLPRGNYHYDPAEHVLTLIDDSEAGLTELLDTAKVAAGSTEPPPVLITMTTRIARLSWIYSGVAYSTTLKHVGALQQTLHLMATAMGLGSGAIEAGDGTAASEVLRLDWPSEVSVGEFVLGHRS
jgi:SagB-type dehydrogenase family enzyme